MRYAAMAPCALALTVIGGGALAQTPPPPAPMPPTYAYPQNQMSGTEMARRFETDEFRLEAEKRLAAEDPERVDLAQRVAALVEAGQCTDARNLANSEGDRRMALRVRQTCRARPQ